MREEEENFSGLELWSSSREWFACAPTTHLCSEPGTTESPAAPIGQVSWYSIIQPIQFKIWYLLGFFFKSYMDTYEEAWKYFIHSSIIYWIYISPVSHIAAPHRYCNWLVNNYGFVTLQWNQTDYSFCGKWKSVSQSDRFYHAPNIPG